MQESRHNHLLRFDNFEIDLDAATLRSGGAAVIVEPQVFELIAFLVANRGRLVSYDEIVDNVWKGRIVSDAAIATRVNAARKALGDDGAAQRVIKTVRGRGLRFDLKPLDMASETDLGSQGVAGSVGKPHEIAADMPSIAVLPFDNMSNDPEQSYFADGIVEDIITGLSRVRQFFVIARNSTFTYKGKSADVRQVGRELGVRYVLEGSVRKAGNKLRITGQLIEAGTGHHIWADRFDGELSDVFELQDRITSSVIGAIQPSIRSAEVARSRRKRPESLDAYDLYMQALPLVAMLDRKSNAAGLALLALALQRDPGYASALAMLAWCHAQRCVYNWTDDFASDSSKALDLARRAVHQAADDSFALSMLGAAHTLVRDFARAEDMLARAVTYDPNCSWGWNRLGWLHGYRDRAQESIGCFEKALRLSPLDPMNFNCHFGIGAAHYIEARYDEAVEWMERALAGNPNARWIYRQLIPAYADSGREDAAAEGLRLLLQDYPGMTCASVRAAMLYSDTVMDRICARLAKVGLPVS
ncbi:MAG: winged helix-turn-helix domain-containing tetratricopeptide repeat protein [Hyphomicrobiaceae bacterium]